MASSTSSSKCCGCSRSSLPWRRSTMKSLVSYVGFFSFREERQLTSSVGSSAPAKSPTFTAPRRRAVVVYLRLLEPMRLPRPLVARNRVRETSLRLATSIRRPKLAVVAVVAGSLEVPLRPLPSSETRTRRSNRTRFYTAWIGTCKQDPIVALITFIIACKGSLDCARMKEGKERCKTRRSTTKQGTICEIRRK